MRDGNGIYYIYIYYILYTYIFVVVDRRGHLAIMVKVPSLTVTFNGNCRNMQLSVDIFPSLLMAL